MNNAASVEYALFSPPSPYNALRDGRLLINQLWKLQFGYCAYCGTETRLPRRGADGIEPDEATREHITPKSLNGVDEPRNLLMSCCKCNAKKSSMKVGMFMEYKWGTLSMDAKQRICMVEQALHAYFILMHDGKSKGWVNEYMGLNLCKRLETEARALAAASAELEHQQKLENALPTKPKRRNPPTQQPQSQVVRTVYVPTGQRAALPEETEVMKDIVQDIPESSLPEQETEIEECLRWTRELQAQIPEAHLGVVHRSLNLIERLLHLHNPHTIYTILHAVGNTLVGSSMVDELAGKVPEARRYLDNWENGIAFKSDYLDKLNLPSDSLVTVQSEQLRIQTYLASFNRPERQKVQSILSHLFDTWDSPSYLYITYQNVENLMVLDFKLDHAYANYPKLKNLYH